MTTYPTQPTGDNSVDLTNIFASNSTNKIIMSTEEILEGYNNDGEAATPLTSTPDGNKFNYFWYQVHNTLAWVVNYAKALFDNKLEISGGTMSGSLALGSNKATTTHIPTANADLTNKLYVDTAVSGAMWLGETKMLSYPAIPTLPAGMEVVYADGRALSKSTYSTLYSLLGTTYGGTELGTTFNIPDLRGVAVRGWDNSRGLDPGRSFGSYQQDEYKSHEHTTTVLNYYENGAYPDNVARVGSPGTAYEYTNTWTSNTSGGIETRMKNIALYPVIRVK